MEKIFIFVWHIPRKLLGILIKGYQKTLSPDHGWFRKRFPYGYCKYTPTCSQYGYEVIQKHGVIYGGIKAFYRVLRCNPCSKGGYDPPK